MRIDALKDFPLDSKIETVGDLLDLLIALRVIPYETKYDAKADEDRRKNYDVA